MLENGIGRRQRSDRVHAGASIGRKNCELRCALAREVLMLMSDSWVVMSYCLLYAQRRPAKTCSGLSNEAVRSSKTLVLTYKSTTRHGSKATKKFVKKSARQI
jgi:hypothetical protein